MANPGTCAASLTQVLRTLALLETLRHEHTHGWAENITSLSPGLQTRLDDWYGAGGRWTYFEELLAETVGTRRLAKGHARALLGGAEMVIAKQVAAALETWGRSKVRAYEQALLERTQGDDAHRQRPGIRANMAGRMDDVMLAVQGDSRYGLVSSGRGWESRASEIRTPAPEPEALPAPVMSLMNYLPVMQTHSIKG